METNYDTPGVWRGAQKDYKRLFYSLPDIALIVPVTLQKGYGKLEAGTVMSLNLSDGSTNENKAVPYNPAALAGAYDPGRAYLAADGAASAVAVLKTVEDCYKFAVGDNLIAMDSDGAAVDMGAITAINYSTKTITATANMTTAITVGNNGFVTVLNGAAAGTSDAVGILYTTRNTGEGEDAADAQGALIVGNAVLYKGCLVLYDAAAKTDLSTTDIGQYTILK